MYAQSDAHDHCNSPKGLIALMFCNVYQVLRHKTA